MNPEVSVVLPVYNASLYLEEAIKSIIYQSFPRWELIIINDGSTDGSDEIIRRYLHDNRIKYIVHSRNEGIVKSLNEGIAASEGIFIARMDADDLSLPARLELQYDYMMKNPECVVCGTGYFLLKNNRKKTIRVPVDNDYLKTQLFFSPCFCHPTVLIRKKLAGKDLFYAEEFRDAEDYELWIRLADKGTFSNLNEPLYIYRDHPHQISYLKHQKQMELRSRIREKYFITRMDEKNRTEILPGLNLAGNNVLLHHWHQLESIHTALVYLYENLPNESRRRGTEQCLRKFWLDSCGNHKMGMRPFFRYLSSEKFLKTISWHSLFLLLVKCLLRRFT